MKKDASSSSAKIDPKSIPDTIGTFSCYEGLDGDLIGGGFNPRQACLAKKMLEQLDPAGDDWQHSPITKLNAPLSKDPKKIISITGKNTNEKAFGNGTVTVSKKTLASLSDSARIMTNEEWMPKEFYLRIQNELRDRVIEQDKRTLKMILGDQYLDWEKDYSALGFKTLDQFKKAAQIPIGLLAVNICHAQEIHFFVEQHVSEGKALNKLRTVNLDEATPTVLISTPGVNFKYGLTESEINSYVGDETIQKFIKNMWQNVLTNAVNQNCRYLALPAIGLGGFLPPDWPEADKKRAASFYYEGLVEVLPQFKGKFDKVYVNPVFKFASEEFNKAVAENKAPKEVREVLQEFIGDVKFLAVELAKAGHRCALLNPSDPDVMWGKYDIGEYYKSGDYLGEEDMVATSTASLGSVGISDVYTNPLKINPVPEFLKKFGMGGDIVENLSEEYRKSRTESGFKSSFQNFNIKHHVRVFTTKRDEQMTRLGAIVSHLQKDPALNDHDKERILCGALQSIVEEIEGEKNTYTSRFLTLCQNWQRDLKGLDQKESLDDIKKAYKSYADQIFKSPVEVGVSPKLK